MRNETQHRSTHEEQETLIRVNATSRKRLTPKQAIRDHCIDCVGGASEVKDCQGDKLYDGPCLLFPYRMGRGRPSVKLIRQFCMYCMGGSWKAVKECPSNACPFLHYRLGKNPNVQLSDEQRQQKREMVAAARLHRLKPPKVASPIESFSQERRTAIFDTKDRGGHKKDQK
jgi:hypothetical protein